MVVLLLLLFCFLSERLAESPLFLSEKFLSLPEELEEERALGLRSSMLRVFPLKEILSPLFMAAVAAAWESNPMKASFFSPLIMTEITLPKGEKACLSSSSVVSSGNCETKMSRLSTEGDCC